MKVFPCTSCIPSLLCSIERMEKATSRFRIGLMFLMMGFSVVGSAYAVMLGKRDKAQHINSMAQQNAERHARAKASEEKK